MAMSTLHRKDMETSYEIIEDLDERWGILPNRQAILFDFFAEEIRISTETLYRCRCIARELEMSYDELFEIHPHNLRDIIWDVTDLSKTECDITTAHIVYAMSFVAMAVTGHPFVSFNYTEYIQILYPAFMERRKFLCDLENNRKSQRANMLSARESESSSSEEEDDSASTDVDEEDDDGETMSLDSEESDDDDDDDNESEYIDDENAETEYRPPIISNGYYLVVTR